MKQSSDSYIEYRNRINANLGAGRLSSALSELKSLAAYTQAPWNINEDIASIQQSYELMQKYAIEGYEDASRAQLFESLKRDIRRLTSVIRRHSNLKDASTLYYNTLRFENSLPDSSIASLIDKYADSYSKINGINLAGPAVSDNPDNMALRSALDSLSNRIFNLVWITFPLSIDDESALLGALRNQVLPLSFKRLIVSALMMGVIEFYDERRMVLLAQTYLDSVSGVESQALVAMLLSMWMRRQDISGKRFNEILSAVAETHNWNNDVRMVFLALLRTRDTERITRKMNEEILPQMMKISPDIYKRMSDTDLAVTDEDGEINPDWEEMFDKSGLTDKLRELNDLQLEGADVMMSTFAHLKGFPFFSDMANWFTTFTVDNSAVRRLSKDLPTSFIETIEAAPMLCDSDKYSLLFSLENMPSAGRRMALQQFEQQSESLAEMQAGELNDSNREAEINHYIQDIYRFFKLYRRKNEFDDPFRRPINLVSLPQLKGVFDDTSSLETIASFYFRHKFYEEALDIYRIIENQTAPSVTIYQKIGYCLQRLNRIEEALEAYEKSELLDSDSLWTQRRVAACYKALGNIDMALKYYLKVAAKAENDTDVVLNIGHCYLIKGEYRDAVNQYFKVEFIEGNPRKVLRPLAWALFLSGDYARSEKYYKLLLAENPNVNDFLNAGHLAMAQHNYTQAIDIYTRSILADSGTMSIRDCVKRFEESLRADRTHLADAGVESLLIDLVADRVISSLIYSS